MRLKHIIIMFFLIIHCSCNSEKNESDSYEIMSVILNHELGSKSDEENGLFWINPDKEYNTVLIYNYTNLGEFDNMILTDFHSQINNFILKDLNKKIKIDINKIKGYYRYQLIDLCDDKNKKEVIGAVTFSSISYSENYKKAIFFVKYLCGGHCGFGKLFYLKKEQKWLIEKEEEVYVS